MEAKLLKVDHLNDQGLFKIFLEASGTHRPFRTKLGKLNWKQKKKKNSTGSGRLSPFFARDIGLRILRKEGITSLLEYF